MKKAILLIIVAAIAVMFCSCEKKLDPKVVTGSTIEGIHDDKEKGEKTEERETEEEEHKGVKSSNEEEDIKDTHIENDKTATDEDSTKAGDKK